jgi:UDP-N-acetylmuramoyl-L-alanyl-D-glutamate--2,6-diaminopimelate ligase
MCKLNDLLIESELLLLEGNSNIEIVGLAFDSRKVQAGFAFFALRGTHSDGHQFISKAIELGASAIVCEEMPDARPESVVFVQVCNAAKALGMMASAFYGNPSANLKLVGVTGTNGKTTIATLLYNLCLKLGYRAGLISTISYRINEQEFPASHTTPDQLQLAELMAKMVEEGCDYCFMEVSSHAVDQHRIAGLEFDGAIFTNLTHDHLDYHGTLDAYLKAKKSFFDELSKSAFALTNADDRNGAVMLQNTKAHKLNYSLRTLADFKCKILESHFDGSLIEIDGIEVWTHFVGKFNASNLLAVYGAALALGLDKNEVLTAISELTPVHGRFDTIRSVDGVFAIVDYAHTPDALKNVLSTIDEMRTHAEQLITVAGAGGDRDKTKRPKMAAIACELSDKIILTSDNPRTEDPLQILRDMEVGVDAVSRKKVLTIADRREAIKTAVMLARPGDIILVAGKGHENYQDVMGVKHHFDDKEELANAFGITL